MMDASHLCLFYCEQDLKEESKKKKFDRRGLPFGAQSFNIIIK